jgi:anti-sigma factor RsiW
MGRLFGQRDRKRERRDELLSAYLDDELSAEDRARLEAQLATDQALQAELDALRRTVTLVRDLSPAPLPRNFILPQTMAARPQSAPSARSRRAWTAPFLTAATAVVSLMFVVVLASDLLFSGAGQFASAPAPEWTMTEMMESDAPQEAPAVAPVAEQAVAEVTVEVEAEVVVEAEEALRYEEVPTGTQPPMPSEVPPDVEPTTTSVAQDYVLEGSNGMSATMPSAGGGEPIEEPAPPPVPSPTVAAADVPPPGASPAAELFTAPPPPSSTVVEEADEASPVTPTASARALEGGPTLTPMEDVTLSPQDVGEAEPEVVKAVPGESGDEPHAEYVSPTTTPLPWRALEIVLGLATLGLAIATVSAWRARRQ